MKKNNGFSFRRAGKDFEMFLQFKAAIKAGYTMEIHGPDYVVLSRKRYEQVMHRIYGRSEVTVTSEPGRSIFFDEMSELTQEQAETISNIMLRRRKGGATP